MLRALALVGVLLLATPVEAGTVRGRVVDPSPDVARDARIVTSLDLTDPGQPRATAPVDPVTGEFAIPWDGDEPYWVVVYERFQPIGGPAFDLWLVADLLPFTGIPDEPVIVDGVHPAPLMEQSPVRLEASILTKWGVVVLLVLGLGLGVRFVLKPGDPAPLPVPPRRPTSPRETAAVLAVLAAALALRLKGIASESFDLLELSYTPGIGRPVPAPGTLLELLEEIGRLYCLELTHPPLYHVITGLFGLLGTAEWLMRVPALIASLATIALLWRFLRRWSVPAGLLAAATYAVSAPSIYFGQDATPYALTGLLTLASVIFMMRALEVGTSRGWGAYFGVLVVGFFCHYTMALVGIGQVALLALLAWTRRDDPRWGAAIRLATGPALAWSVLPLAWTYLHFSTHPTVAGYTRLFSDPYIPGPGLVPWTWDFWTVGGSLWVDRTPWAAAALIPLFGLGVHRALRPEDRAFGVLLVALLLTWTFSVRFFYVGQMEVLADKVLYAFRWVGWFVPLVVGTAVLGALHGAGPKALRGALLAIWLSGVGLATWTQITETSRPDYEGAAELIRSELRNRDAVATLPAWFQRGNLAWYLMSTGAEMRRIPEEGDGMWMLDGKAVAIEAIHPSLPFETSARNTFTERLWIAVVDEEMYGRDKFRPAVAEQALAWADEHLVPDGEWTFDRIRLLRYRVEPLPPPAVLSTAMTVANHRTFPPLGDVPGFVPPEQLDLPPRLGRTVLHNAPMSPGCVDWLFTGLHEALDPESKHHWYLNARLHVPPDEPLPRVIPSDDARLFITRQADVMRIDAVGGACDGPPLELRIEAILPDDDEAMSPDPGPPDGLPGDVPGGLPDGLPE